MKVVAILVMLVAQAMGCGSGGVAEEQEVLFGSPGLDVWDSGAEPLDGLPSRPDSPGTSDGYEAVAVGGLGWPCEDGGDCVSGYCVPGTEGGGSFCTVPCVEDCPEGMSCRLAPQTLPDPIYICLPHYPPPWCRPCREAADCADPWAEDSLSCHLESPEAGSFCTHSCADEMDCPEGLACVSGRCRPMNGCTCLEGGIDASGWETDCVVGSSMGECHGVRVCAEDGMSACSAPAPMPEICNGLDDDCDGVVDPLGAVGCGDWWMDGDGDGAGGGVTACRCAGAPGWVQVAGDCDDTDAGISPSMAEICDGIDQDCDRAVDEPPAVGCVTAWLDGDGDGWGGAESLCVCVPGLPYVLLGGDCDDGRPDIHPGAPEICDGLDQDCNGVEDASCDEDGDGWCQGPPPTSACSPGTMGYGLCLAIHFQALLAWCPLGFGDCDDQVPGIHPNAAEICDGADNDCDGVVDEGMDLDGDGWCLDDSAACCPEGGGDCDDLSPWIHPGAVDLPDPALVDSNCDGLDGDIGDAVFVHGGFGHDFLPGTLFFPKKTIQSGIDEAASQGLGQVLVGAASYPESLALEEGVGVYGRYTVNGGWKRHAVGLQRATVMSTIGIAVFGDGLGAAAALVGLEIHAADAGPGDSVSVPVYARQSPGLTLRDLSLHTGDGWSGQDGVGGQHGDLGLSGEDGRKGCNVPGCIWGGTCNSAHPMGGGYQFSCNVAYCACGGMGQNYSTWTQPEMPDLPWPWLQTQRGQHSCWYRYQGPGKGGEGGAKGVHGHKDAWAGQAGIDGEDGPPGGTAFPGGWKSFGWQSGNGGQGWPGTRGTGGGGGGKGRNRDQPGLFECNTLGGEGGGAGEGGEGASGGKGGAGGVPVFGILLQDSPALVQACEVNLGQGGNGGHGGAGGVGGIGGTGGTGGAGYKSSGEGGDGGAGGRGGHGGGGAGGAGGHAIGALWTCGAAPTIDGFSVQGGVPGVGGQGGASSGNPGPDGPDGVLADTWCVD